MLRPLLLIETTGPGGAEKMLLREVKIFKTLRLQPIVIILGEGWLYDKLSLLDVETYVIPLKHSIDISWLSKTINVIKQRNVDAIHSHEFAMNFYAAFIGKILKLPVVTTVHGKNYYSEKLHRRVAYRFVSKNTKMVAVSQDIKSHLLANVGVKEKRVYVIQNGVDTEKYSPNDAIRFAKRKDLGINNDQLLIGAVGNLYPIKGHKYLLEAASTLIKRNKNIQLLIAGRGELQHELENQCAELGIIENVSLLGFREDVDEILQALDIFVMPSLSEGLPLSVLESMAVELPIVASRVGGIPDVIENNVTGLLVEPKQAKQIESALESLLGSTELRKKVGKLARNKVVEDFSLERCINSYIDLLDDSTSDVAFN